MCREVGEGAKTTKYAAVGSAYEGTRRQHQGL